MAYINSIEYYLPNKSLSNEELSTLFPEWNVERIMSKVGISKRYVTDKNEFASDLAIEAANKLFEKNNIKKNNIDFLIYCTQSPDYLLPTTACIIQDKLGLKNIGAFDFNLGCSGFIYGLSIAKGLIFSGIANNILFITSETYTKFIEHNDKSNRSIFGDAAAATLVTKEKGICKIGNFLLGSDGSGYSNLIAKKSGLRGKLNDNFNDCNFYMNGPEIFNFTGVSVPNMINDYLEKYNYKIHDFDFFLFHQANKHMMNYLRRKTKISKEKFIIELENFGNTVSSTIPIALFETLKKNKIKSKNKVFCAGFGVGYSWGSTVLYF